MSYFTSKNGSQIFLNLDRIDRKDDDDDLSEEGAKALKLITSIRSTKQLTPVHLAAVDAIYDEEICISPYTIFEQPLHRDICRHFNEISELGCELRLQLEAAGAFTFLEKVNNRQSSQGIIERILAIFSVSTVGLSKVSDMPSDYIHAVADFFRTSDGLRWNTEILGVNGISPQCVSNVVSGLAKISNDITLTVKARKYRSPSSSYNPSWLAFQHSADALDKELLELSRDFREESLTRPSVVQAAIMNIASWMKQTFPNEKVHEVVLSPTRPEIFTTFLTKRSGGKPTRTTLSTVQAARRLSVSISERLVRGAGGRALFDLVSQKEVNKIKNEIERQPKPNSARSRPLPEKLIPIMKEILEEGENGWPGKTFRVDILIKGKAQNLYCPVIPSLFRGMLDVPLRMAQIRRLDSGEGDVRHFNVDTMEWEENSGPLAGYWADHAGESRKNFPTRGYAIEIQDEIKPDLLSRCLGLYLAS